MMWLRHKDGSHRFCLNSVSKTYLVLRGAGTNWDASVSSEKTDAFIKVLPVTLPFARDIAGSKWLALTIVAGLCEMFDDPTSTKFRARKGLAALEKRKAMKKL